MHCCFLILGEIISTFLSCTTNGECLWLISIRRRWHMFRTIEVEEFPGLKHVIMTKAVRSIVESISVTNLLRQKAMWWITDWGLVLKEHFVGISIRLLYYVYQRYTWRAIAVIECVSRSSIAAVLWNRADLSLSTSASHLICYFDLDIHPFGIGLLQVKIIGDIIAWKANNFNRQETYTDVIVLSSSKYLVLIFDENNVVPG